MKIILPFYIYRFHDKNIYHNNYVNISTIVDQRLKRAKKHASPYKLVADKQRTSVTLCLARVMATFRRRRSCRIVVGIADSFSFPSGRFSVSGRDRTNDTIITDLSRPTRFERYYFCLIHTVPLYHPRFQFSFFHKSLAHYLDIDRRC